MDRKIIFLGGIHGVGKGTLAKKISSQFSLQHLSASEVLKWNEISKSGNKKVFNFTTTQERLLYNLELITQPENFYLLDGHFVLLNSKGDPEKIDESTFIAINPISIILLTSTPRVIAEQLRKRDGVQYDLGTLKKMQEMEWDHSFHIAKKLNIPFLEVQSDSFDEVQKFIENYESIN